MACLETTFLVDLLRGKPEIEKILDDLDKTEQTLSIATPSLMELWAGVCWAEDLIREKEKISRLLSSFVFLPLDVESSKESGEIEVELAKKGLKIQTEDVMIAAIARVNSEKLVTRDADYARIPRLQILKY